MGSRASSVLTAAAILLFSVPSALALLQSGEEQALPEGKGKEAVETACAVCHSLSKVTAKRQSRSDWERTVQSMVERGARVSTEEANSIAGYLAQHFGDSGSPAAAEPKATPDGAGTEPHLAPLPAGAGREMTAEKCSQCHGEGMWREVRQDRKRWEATVYRMVGKGALWTQEEIDTLVTYLSTAFPPKSKAQGSAQ